MILSKHLRIFSLCTLITVFSVACNDDDEPVVDSTAPVISIISPENGAELASGTDVTINVTIEEANELQEVIVTGTLATPFGPFQESTTIEKDELPAKSGNIYAVNQQYTIPSLASGNVTIKIVARDEAGNEGEETATYTIR
ncbi:hypothetical protein D770_06725 [Flammeovirgaceae bacterium 311]|nr:hypothetical protein D770_06725 [Flammeovirgaceae bacterium 311]